MRMPSCVSVLLLLLGSCHTAGGPPPRPTAPDDSLLVQLSDTERGQIDAARADRSRAKDAYAAAQVDSKTDRDHLAAANTERDRARDRVDAAEASLASANVRGSNVEVDTATQSVQTAKTDHALQNGRAVLCERRSTFATARELVADAHVQLTEARVVLAKVRALNTLDRPEQQKPEVSPFESMVRRAEADENAARVRADAAEREVSIAALDLQTRERAAGSR